MSMFKSTFEHSNFYDKFIDLYNKSEQKTQAVTDIKAHRDVLLDQEKMSTDEVNEHYQELKNITKTPPHSEDLNERRYNEYLKKAMKQILTVFDEQIKNEHHIDNPDLTLKNFRKVIGKSFGQDHLAFYPAIECTKKAERICELGGAIDKYRGEQRHLNKILQQAINDGYPPELNKWGQLPKDEKQELRGAVLKKINKKESAQATHYPEILKAADKVIGDKKLSDFKTKGGNAKADLYNGILRRYDKVPLGTLKDWLNEDLKSGDFKKKLKKMRDEKNFNTSLMDG